MSDTDFWSKRVRLAATSEIPEGSGKAFQIMGKTIAVFNSGGHFYAIDNHCPHRKGPLASGVLEGTVVTCPWHGWEFDVATGRALHDESLCVSRFQLHVENGAIFVVLEQAQSNRQAQQL